MVWWWSDRLPLVCPDYDPELAGWYLSPTQHFIELIVSALLLIGLFVYTRLVPSSQQQSQSQAAAASSASSSASAAAAPRATPAVVAGSGSVEWQPRARSAFDHALILVTVLSLCTVVVHKYNEDKMFYLLQPCHTLQAMMIVIMVLGSGSRVAQRLFNVYLNLYFSAVLGMLAADTSVYTQPLEYENWALQHALLCLLPYFFIATRRFPVVHERRFFVQSFAVEVFWHYFVLVPMGLLSAMNLNYMFCPPAGILADIGAIYRPVFMVVCMLMAWLLRVLVINPFSRVCGVPLHRSLLPVAGKATHKD